MFVSSSHSLSLLNHIPTPYKKIIKERERDCYNEESYNIACSRCCTSLMNHAALCGLRFLVKNVTLLPSADNVPAPSPTATTPTLAPTSNSFSGFHFRNPTYTVWYCFLANVALIACVIAVYVCVFRARCVQAWHERRAQAIRSRQQRRRTQTTVGAWSQRAEATHHHNQDDPVRQRQEGRRKQILKQALLTTTKVCMMFVSVGLCSALASYCSALFQRSFLQ